MYLFNYLFFRFSKNRTSNPRFYGLMSITVIEGFLLLSIFKVVIIEIYDYSKFIEMQESGLLRVLIIIPVLIIGLINHYYYSGKRIKSFLQRWEHESPVIIKIKVVAFLILVIGLTLFLPTIFNGIRGYW